jgi:hypothetical protein
MRRSTHFLLCVAFVLFGLAGWSRAQEAVVRRVDNAGNTAVSLDLIELESSYTFESDLHRNGSFGDQYSIQNSFAYGHRFFLRDHLYLHLGIAYDRFDFGATAAPVPEHLQSVAAVIGVDYMHNNDVGAFIQLKPGIYTESDFDGAAFDVPITLGRIWVLQPDHLYLFTGATASFLRGRFPVIPIAGLIWEPNDQWKVLAMLPEPRVIYSPNKNWDFWVGGELAGGSFRTDHDNTIVPARLNGAQVDYSEYRVGAGLIYSPSENVSFDLGGGYAIQRQFDFHRADLKYKADGAPYLRLEFKAKF